jgi:phospholipid/cholesterol/gamma-HCH transport system substrate-binding protein
MKITASQKIRIGLFTIIGLAILVIGIFLIGRNQNMFGDNFKVYGTYKTVGGLQVGNNIRFAGINVGTVENITIISDTIVRVDMLLQSKIKPFLKTSSLATIGSDGLMGDKLVMIAVGEPNAALLKDGEKIKTANPLDFDKTMVRITKVAENAETLSASLAGISVQLSQGKGSLGRLLYKDDLAVALEGTVNNMKTMSGSLAGVTTEIKSGKGSIGRLIYSDELAKSLEGTAANAKITMATVNDAAFGFSENMKALQGNIFFRGYFKKQAKAKEKASQDSLTNTANVDDTELNESELKEIQEAADKAEQDILARKAKKPTVIKKD